MQVPARPFIWLLTILILIGFWAGVLKWNNKSYYKCFDGKHYYGDWVTVAAVGKFELRVKQYGCTAEDRYDPKVTRPLWEYHPSPSPTNQP